MSKYQQEFVASTLQGTDMLWNFYSSVIVTKLASDDKSKVYHVSLEEDPDGDYWAWLDLKDKQKPEITMVFPYRESVEICFPYGTKVEEQRGYGRVIRCKVEKIQELNWKKDQAFHVSPVAEEMKE